MTTLQLMRQIVSDSNAHHAARQTLHTMIQEGHPDSITQRSITANALTRWEKTLRTFRQRYPNRDEQMIRIILASR